MFDKTSLFADFAAGPEQELVETNWGRLYVRAMTAGEKDRWDLRHAEVKGADFRARLVVACAFTEEGQPAFAASDIPALSALPVPALEPVVDTAVRINRMLAADVETLQKN